MPDRKQPLLEGQVIDAGDAQILAEQLDRLERKIREKKEELREVEQMNLASSAKLRALHVALCAFFDESTVSVGQESTSSNSGWERIKSRLNPRQSKIVDLLLVQPGMTLTQIAAATHAHYDTAKKTVADLKRQGLVQNNGDGHVLAAL